MLGALPLAVYSVDLSGRLTYYNYEAVRLWGWQPEMGLEWWKCFKNIARADGASFTPTAFIAAAVFDGATRCSPEFLCERADGETAFCVFHSAPLLDEGNIPIGIVVAAAEALTHHDASHDNTSHTSYVTRPGNDRVANEMQRIQLSEFKHRMKNTLATVQGIAAQTFRHVPAAERDLFAMRLKALDDAHALVLREQSEPATLNEVLGQVLAPFQDDETRVSMTGPAVDLRPNACLVMSMVFHELATNAIKYGALSGNGSVAITWTTAMRGDKKFLDLRWLESGGPEVVRPTHKGFGTMLIEGAFSGLAGTSRLLFQRTGVFCEITCEI